MMRLCIKVVANAEKGLDRRNISAKLKGQGN